MDASISSCITRKNYINCFSADESKHQNEQKTLSKWIDQAFEPDFKAERCFFATLLFVEDIKRDDAMRNYTNFSLHLNRMIYGKALKRYPENKKPVKQVAFIEGDGIYKQHHYHSIFVNPYDRQFSDEYFINLIMDCWLVLPKAMKNPSIAVKVEKISNLDKVIGYITKNRTKAIDIDISYLDSLDTNNSYF